MAAIEPIKLEFGPGLVKLGTVFQTPAGRYYDANLMRMSEGVIKPMKGWAIGLAGVLTGTPRAAHGWKDNDGNPFAIFATHADIYAHDGTTLDDISPASDSGALLMEDGEGFLLEDGSTELIIEGFQAGDADTSTWTLDNFGEIGIACNDSEGYILEWQPGGGGDATVISNSPSALAITVTAERFIFALGSDLDPRRIAWCDGENYTTWTPGSTNRAREYLLQSPGVLMCGARVSGGHLIWTSHDIHFARYVGLPDVYSIRPAGGQCGIVGRHAYCVTDQFAYWMGESAFWVWAGYAEPLPCSIQDDVFKNINETHRHKVWCLHNVDNGEVWFFYPRGDETECSHAAVYVYRGQPHWNHVELARNCGFPGGIFTNPIMVSSDGYIYRHEYGWGYGDNVLMSEGGEGLLLEDGSTILLESDAGATRNLTSGPFDISNGGALLLIDEIIPDELIQGDCSVYFYASEYPTDDETTFGPYTNGDRIVIEAPARKIRMEVRASSGVGDFRVGTFRAVVKEWSAY